MAMLPSAELARALVLWQRAAGPYWLYVCAAPFVAPAPDRSSARARVPSSTLDEAFAAMAPAAFPLLVVDLPPADTLPAAPALNERGYLVVPIIQRWCSARGRVDAHGLPALLASVAGALHRPHQPRGIVFVLDGERAGGNGPAARNALDNRYAYRSCRFPPPRRLALDGVDAVGWVARGGIAPDMIEYAGALGSVGLPPRTLPAE